MSAPALADRLREDALFRLVSHELGDPHGGAWLCGMAVAQAAAGSEIGGLLIAVEDVAFACDAVSRVTGLVRVPDRSHPEIRHLARRGERTVTLVPLGPGISQSCAHASYTALSMAVRLSDPGILFDPYDGMTDLEAGILRLVEPCLREKPERMLLASVLNRRFGLVPDPGTGSEIRFAAPYASNIPPRKVWGSLSSSLATGGLSATAGLLKDLGLLSELFVPVGAIYAVPQNYYHHLDVWGHTMETLERLDEMLARPFDFFKAYGDRMVSQLTRRVEGGVLRLSLLALAALVHDIGKAETMTVQESGRIRFQGHAEAGASLSNEVSRRLGFGARATRRLAAVVGDHMRLGFLMKEGESAGSRLRAAVEMGDRTIEVVMLSLADRMATRGEAATEEALKRFTRLSTRLMSDWFWLRDFPPLVDGEDIIVHMGIEPGPDVGEALFRARVAQRESIVSSRDEALEYLAPDFKGKMSMRGLVTP